MNDSIGTLYIEEDNLIRWTGLYDKAAMVAAGRKRPAAADFINDATITWIIRAAAADGSYDSAGAQVSSGGGTMSYVDDSNGDYYGTIEDGAALTNGSTYWLVASMSASGDRVGSRKLKFIAGLHGNN